mmetsp:Transcript_21128/g.65197  ORF Transcript_21128/g.65197 Transcript_21128/m.65197 type:complete len:456 (+) Transcript_21128:48-1415(+)
MTTDMADLEAQQQHARKRPPGVDWSLGETVSLMKHAFELKKPDADHSRDQEWPVSGCLKLTDAYAVATSAVWLLLKMCLLVLPLYFCALPVCVAARLYGCCLKSGQDVLRGRWRLFFLLTPLAVPFLFLAFVALVFDYLFYYLLSLPVFVLRCLACQARLCSSYAALGPYRSGPSIVWYLNDVWVALVGQTLRHGLCECSLKLACMAWYVPWIKYYLNANPLLYNLDERFVQQISTSTDDMNTGEVVATAKKLISRAKNETKDIRQRQDASTFVPHYPYPPKARDFALGLQAGGTSLYGSFFVTHTTHALQVDSTRPRKSHYFVLSNSCEIPCYRVLLWYNNPYHIFTGYVEASVSNGRPAQPAKRLGFEHPMWLVTAHSPLLSRRTSWVGPGFIDRFFDTWFPSFVSLVRLMIRGERAALELHQVVQSQDGVSPAVPIGAPRATTVPGRVVVEP